MLRRACQPLSCILAGLLLTTTAFAQASLHDEYYDSDGNREPNEIAIVSKAPANFLTSQNATPVQGITRTAPYLEASYLKLINEAKSLQLKDLFGDDRPEERNEKRLRSGEFYTFIKIDNYFNDDVILDKCDKRTNTHWFLSVSLKIDYQGLKGSQLVSFVPESVIVLDGNHAESGGKLSRGCTFKSLNLRQTGPYMLYSGFDPGQGEYILHFNASTGSTRNESVLAAFSKLALSVVGALPGLTVPTGVGPAISTLASTLDPIIDRNKAYITNVQYAAVLTAVRAAQTEHGEVGEYQRNEPWKSVTGFYLRIYSPYIDAKNDLYDYESDRKRNECRDIGRKIECAGFIEIYQGRSASIILDSGKDNKITVDAILRNPGLGVPHICLPGTGGCGKDASNFSKAWGKSFELTGDFATHEGREGKLGAGVENWGKVFNACDQIRATASELGLSTIDSLLIRWALLQKSGLYTILKTHRENRGASPYTSAIQKARLGDPSPEDRCWSTKDTTQFNAIQAIFGNRLVEYTP